MKTANKEIMDKTTQKYKIILGLFEKLIAEIHQDSIFIPEHLLARSIASFLLLMQLYVITIFFFRFFIGWLMQIRTQNELADFIKKHVLIIISCVVVGSFLLLMAIVACGVINDILGFLICVILLFIHKHCFLLTIPLMFFIAKNDTLGEITCLFLMILKDHKTFNFFKDLKIFLKKSKGLFFFKSLDSIIADGVNNYVSPELFPLGLATLLLQFFVLVICITFIFCIDEFLTAIFQFEFLEKLYFFLSNEKNELKKYGLFDIFYPNLEKKKTIVYDILLAQIAILISGIIISSCCPNFAYLLIIEIPF